MEYATLDDVYHVEADFFKTREARHQEIIEGFDKFHAHPPKLFRDQIYKKLTQSLHELTALTREKEVEFDKWRAHFGAPVYGAGA